METFMLKSPHCRGSRAAESLSIMVWIKVKTAPMNSAHRELYNRYGRPHFELAESSKLTSPDFSSVLDTTPIEAQLPRTPEFPTAEYQIITSWLEENFSSGVKRKLSVFVALQIRIRISKQSPGQPLWEITTSRFGSWLENERGQLADL